MSEERDTIRNDSDSVADGANSHLTELKVREKHAAARRAKIEQARRGYEWGLVGVILAASVITICAGVLAAQLIVPNDSPSTGIAFEAVKVPVKEQPEEEPVEIRSDIADAQLMAIEEFDGTIDTTSNDADIVYSTTVEVDADDELELAMRLADEEQMRHEAQLNAIRKAEADKNRTIQIALSAHSVDRDLKVQFTDDATGKLVSGVPLSVSVAPENGIGVLYEDDDADGIIHLTELAAGEYTVVQSPITDASFARYQADPAEKKVRVNEEIQYEMVDVGGMIENESDTDFITEDSATARKEREESTEPLADTVKFLASSKTEVSAGKGERTDIVEFKKISVNDIADPTLDARLNLLSSKLILFSATETYELGLEPDTSAYMYSVPVIDQTEATSAQEEDVVDIGEATTPVSDAGASNSNEPSAADTVDVTKPAPAPGQVPVEEPVVQTETPTVPESMIEIEEVTESPAGQTKPQTEEAEEDAGEEEEEEIPVTEKKIDPEAKLKDTSGRQVYIRNAVGHYVAATGKDLSDDNTFYIRIESVKYYKYAGWQTIQGTTYYYDETGSRVTGDQVIQGVAYTFRADGSLSTGGGIVGVDVSRFNKDIDWRQVRNAGVSFAIIRCGYRGSTGGNLIEDMYFRTNIQNATAAGIRVGVYFVTQAVNETEAVEEASMALSLVSGYHLSLPIFADSESSGGRGDTIDAATRTATIKAFCRTCSNAGYRSGVYASTNWMNNNLHMSELTDYNVWVAQYNNIPTYTKTKYDIWQYSSHGRLPGVETEIDMDIMYTNY